MPTPYAGTPPYPATISVPDDGDKRNTTVWGAPLQQLADRTAALVRAAPAGNYFTFQNNVLTGNYVTVGVTGSYADDPTIFVVVSSCVVGDVLDISLHTGGVGWSLPGQALAHLFAKDNFNGTPVDNDINHSAVQTASPEGDGVHAFTLLGTWVVQTAGDTKIGLRYQALNHSFIILNGIFLAVRRIRT